MGAQQGSRFLRLGRLCVDFTFTGGRDGVRAHYELLGEPDGLRRFLAESDLAVATEVDAADLDRAWDLREACWFSLRGAVGYAAPSAADVRTLNAAAAEPPLVPVLDVAEDTAAGTARWHRPTARQALSSVARDAIAMLGDPAARDRIRECANPKCLLIFYDDSRPGRRRWCQATRCGDRIRAQAYRARQRP